MPSKKFNTMDQTSEEKPQAPEDQRGPNYDNEVPVKSWLRGGNEDATRMPFFDKSKKWK